MSFGPTLTSRQWTGMAFLCWPARCQAVPKSSGHPHRCLRRLLRTTYLTSHAGCRAPSLHCLTRRAGTVAVDDEAAAQPPDCPEAAEA